MYQNVLDEPSPLGLRLKKSPSLLDLIQMRLSQASNAGESSMDNSGLEPSKKKDNKSGMSTAGERLKASNFPANILKIGTWEVRFFNFFCCSLWVLPEPQYASGPCIPFFFAFFICFNKRSINITLTQKIPCGWIMMLSWDIADMLNTLYLAGSLYEVSVKHQCIFVLSELLAAASLSQTLSILNASSSL